jgi:hypothetical protein
VTRRGAFPRVGVLAGCALALSLWGAASASARTNGFWIYNLTSDPLKLIAVKWHGYADNGRGHPEPPEVGEVLAPGLPPRHIEIYDQGGDIQSSVALTYSALGPDDPRRTITLTLIDHDSSGDEKATCEGSPEFLQCERVHKPFYGKMGIVEPPGTDRSAPADNPQKQAEVLRNLCTRTNLAGESHENAFVECEFTPEPSEIFGPFHAVGYRYANCDRSNDKTVRTQYADRVVVTNSLGLERGPETDTIFERARAGAKYANRQSWLEEHLFRYSPDLTIPPGHLGWAVASNPLLRHKGDFRLHIGNTTWVLRDVYFDTPYPRSGSRLIRPKIETKTEPLSAEQRAKLCDSGSSNAGLVRVAARYATIPQRGTRRAAAHYGGRESTTVIALARNDIVRGGAGDDTLFGGPGNDVIYGGQGSDRIVDTSGPAVVYSGAGGSSGRDFCTWSRSRSDGATGQGPFCESPDVSVGRVTAVVAGRGQRV